MSKNKLGFFKIILSVLSSFIGIQTNKNRKRDFAANKPIYFIIVGLALTLLFVLLLYFLVIYLISF